MKKSALQKKIHTSHLAYLGFCTIAIIISFWAHSEPLSLIYLPLFLISLGSIKNFRFTRLHKWLRPLHVIWLILALNLATLVLSVYFAQAEPIYLAEIGLNVIMVFTLLGMLKNISADKKKNKESCEFC